MNGWLNGWKNMSRVLFVVAVWYQNVWLADFVMEWWCLVCLSVRRFNVCCILVAIMKMVAMMMLLFCCLSCRVYRFSTAFRLRTGIIVLHFLFFFGWKRCIIVCISLWYCCCLCAAIKYRYRFQTWHNIGISYCCYCCCFGCWLLLLLLLLLLFGGVLLLYLVWCFMGFKGFLLYKRISDWVFAYLCTFSFHSISVYFVLFYLLVFLVHLFGYTFVHTDKQTNKHT